MSNDSTKKRGALKRFTRKIAVHTKLFFVGAGRMAKGFFAQTITVSKNTGKAAGRGFARAGRFAALTIYLIFAAIGILALAILSGAFKILAWTCSLLSRAVYGVGVGLAIVGLVLAMPISDYRWVTTVVHPQTARIVVDQPVAEDPSFEMFYREKLDNDEVAEASFWFGKWQARAARVEGLNLNQAWGLLNKEVRKPENPLHISKVREGWDEEANAAKVGA